MNRRITALIFVFFLLLSVATASYCQTKSNDYQQEKIVGTIEDPKNISEEESPTDQKVLSEEEKRLEKLEAKFRAEKAKEAKRVEAEKQKQEKITKIKAEKILKQRKSEEKNLVKISERKRKKEEAIAKKLQIKEAKKKVREEKIKSKKEKVEKQRQEKIAKKKAEKELKQIKKEEKKAAKIAERERKIKEAITKKAQRKERIHEEPKENIKLIPTRKTTAGIYDKSTDSVVENIRHSMIVAPEVSVKPEVLSEFTLEECINIAMENHLPLEIAEKQLSLAKFRLFEAQRKLGPSVTAKWEESSGVVQGRHYTGKKLQIEGKQPLFYGGELVYAVRQAKVNMEIVNTDYSRIKNDLILQVKKAYYSLDKANKALSIQGKLDKDTERLYNIAKTGYEAEAVAQVEFLKISSQKNQANFQLVSAYEDISIANLILQQALNIDEEINIAEVKSPRRITIELEDCYTLAYLNRPEIKINYLSIEYFKYEKKILQARSNFPRVDFLGMYGNMQEDFVPGDLGPGKDPRGFGPEYYVGVKATVPIWGSTVGYSLTREDWQPVVSAYQGTKSTTSSTTFDVFNKLEDISAVKEAELEYMRSQEELNKKKQEISLEIKETFFKYKKALLLLDVAQSKIMFQSKQVEILKIRHELGEALYSDVAEEMIKLAEEEFSYFQAVTDYYIAIATLNKAVGLEDYFKITD